MYASGEYIRHYTVRIEVRIYFALYGANMGNIFALYGANRGSNIFRIFALYNCEYIRQYSERITGNIFCIFGANMPNIFGIFGANMRNIFELLFAPYKPCTEDQDELNVERLGMRSVAACTLLSMRTGTGVAPGG
jgi:hypothetical protein